MSDGLFGALQSIIEASQERFYGVAAGQVVDIVDPLDQGRVKVRLPWFNENEITGWARIAAPSAGSDYGHYFVPQVDEEVLVAFEHGDIEQPYVIGRLWNLEDQPPEPSPLLGKSHISTITGHDIVFDDRTQSIEIKTSTSERITLDPLKIELSNSAGTVIVTLNSSSRTISLQAAATIELNAPNIKINGANVEINGTTKTDVKSAGVCNVKAPLVKIN